MKQRTAFRIVMLACITIMIAGLLAQNLASSAAARATSETAQAREQKEEVNGSFSIQVLDRGVWKAAGTLSYGRNIVQKQLDVAGLGGLGQTQVRIAHTGPTAAHIDQVLLGSAAPEQVEGAAEPPALALKKLASRDYDVVDAQHRSFVLHFADTDGGTPPTLSLSARIEPEHIPQDPFQFPGVNTFKEVEKFVFYSYALNSNRGTLTLNGELNDEELGTPFFKEYSVPGTGHPPADTCGWVFNDDHYLYVAIDFASDNTMDGTKDYAAVYVRTDKGVRTFKVSVPEQEWGTPGFTYTPRVAYQHKVYEFRIPLEDMGLSRASNSVSLELGFAAYGTSAPSMTTNPATNVGSASATLNGVAAHGGNNVVGVWFEWGTTSGGPYPNTHSLIPPDPNITSGSRTFTYDVTGLSSNTTYYYRIGGEDAYHSPNYGAEQSFTTGGDVGGLAFFVDEEASPQQPGIPPVGVALALVAGLLTVSGGVWLAQRKRNQKHQD